MSKLTEIFNQLGHGSLSAVQNGQNLTELAKYLNVERPIEKTLKEHMEVIRQNGGGLVLLIGNAGDGKSHIISQLKSSGLYDDFAFYNDATESCSPKMSSLETLKTALKFFSDEEIDKTELKWVLAINLGKLNEFENDVNFSRIGELAHAVLNDNFNTNLQSEHLRFVSFSNQQSFELDPQSQEGYPIDSIFIKTVLNKITHKTMDNPFYEAYVRTLQEKNGNEKPEVINFELLSLPAIQNSIVKLLIECIIRYKLILTPRDLFDFIHSIIVYPTIENYKEKNHFFEALLPTAVFHGSTSKIQKTLSLLDPLSISSLQHNTDLSILFTSFNIPKDILDKKELGTASEVLFKKINTFYPNHGIDTERISKFVFRLKHLMCYHSEKQTYKDFVKLLADYHAKDKRDTVIRDLEEIVNVCIPRHYGSYVQKEELVPLNIQGSQYRLFAKINKDLDPVESPYIGDNLNEFILHIPLKWLVESDEGDKEINLKVDYVLYEYLMTLKNGKLPISYESELNMDFSRFIRELIKYSSSMKEVVVISSTGKEMSLKSRSHNLVSLL